MRNPLTIPRTIAIVISSLGLLSACGIGSLVNRPPVPPPPTQLADLVLHPSSLDFGFATVKGKPVTRIVEVTNPSRYPVVIQSTRIDNHTFQVAGSDCGYVLHPSATCTTTIHFEPFHAGHHDGILTFTLEGFAPLSIPMHGEASTAKPSPAD